MPFGDGTGPLGQGPGVWRGMGRGRSEIRSNAGPGGYCICPSCGAKAPHQAGMPCSSLACTNCGARMIRQ
jgi:hypothetical protein